MANTVTVSGEIEEIELFAYNYFGNTEYVKVILGVPRLSGEIDHVPVLLGEQEGIDSLEVGENLEVVGEIRKIRYQDSRIKDLNLAGTWDDSYQIKHKEVQGVVQMRIVVVAQQYDKIEKDVSQNCVTISGTVNYVCLRHTLRLNLSVCDLSVRVYNDTGKSCLVPVILWGENAEIASKLEVGTKIIITGRFQTRDYTKNLADGHSAELTMNEISGAKFKVIEKREGERYEN